MVVVKHSDEVDGVDHLPAVHYFLDHYVRSVGTVDDLSVKENERDLPPDSNSCAVDAPIVSDVEASTVGSTAIEDGALSGADAGL